MKLLSLWTIVTILIYSAGGMAAASPNSILLTWTAPGDDGTVGTASQYDIRYSTSAITAANWASAIQATGEPTPKVAGSAESFTVTGLAASTTYYFAIKTADEIPNWSGLSNVVIKATSAESAPPATITNFAAGAATSTSMPLTWTAPGDDSITGTASQYDIRYSTSTITEANWASATQATGEPTPKVAGSAESFTVSGLSPNTTYYFAIKTADEVPNWSGLSNIVSKATAQESIPPAAIANLSTGVVTSTSVALIWTAPGDDGTVGTASQYDIRYSTSAITAANWASAIQATGEPTPKVAGSAESFTVTGLAASTTYYFAIKTADEIPNWSGLSNVVIKATSAESAPPATITNFAAGAATSTSMPLTWTAPGDDSISGTASQYDIRYSTSTITVANWASATQATGEPTPRVGGSAESFTVSGLSPNTTYYFAIKTADEVPNWSALSNVAQRATLDQIPPARINDLAAAPGASSGEIHLSWTATGDDGTVGTASAYVMRYSTDPISDTSWHSITPYRNTPLPAPAGTAQSMIMSGLQPGQLYYVALKVRDDFMNESELSNVATATAKTDFVLDLENEQVAIASPAPGSEIHSSHPILAVNNINSGPDNEYYFEVASDSFFMNVVAASPPIPQGEGQTTSWKVTEKLSGIRAYFWRARANNFSYSYISQFTLNPAPHAYPNPFNPNTIGNVTFTDIPERSSLILVSISGDVVRKWNNIMSGELNWNGSNESGSLVAPGVYVWYISGTESKGKIVVVR